MARVRPIFRLWRTAWVIAAVGAAAAVTVSPAQAGSYVVTNTDDFGAGSLRNAIEDANLSVGADTITFSVTGTITNWSGSLPTIRDNLTIDGPAASSLTIDGNFRRVLLVEAGVRLDLEGITITNGHCCGPPQIAGAGILNRGTLIVSNTTFFRNIAEAGDNHGGAIANDGGSVTVTNSRFLENEAHGAGAGIYSTGGTLTISGSTFSTNSTSWLGGGIYNVGGTLSVTNSTFSGNASWGDGGGIGNEFGAVSVSNSTFNENRTSVSGGAGIWNYAGTLTITNSTFTGNSADVWPGGAIRNWEGTTVVTSSSLSGNSAGAGGGIWNTPWSDPSTFVVRNSIVASSASGGNCSGPFTDGGGNLQYPGRDCGGNITSADPLLDPSALQDNGGPTETIALQPGSPAIDAAVLANCPSTDQRTVTRPQGAGCDIGAYELVQSIPVTIDIVPGSNTNFINLSKKGVIPVAVLWTPTFDPATVDPTTVCFGDFETPAERDCSVAPGTVLEDVNKDKKKDLVLHFETQEAGIDQGDTRACLTGKLFDDTSIEGCDSIKTK